MPRNSWRWLFPPCSLLLSIWLSESQREVGQWERERKRERAREKERNKGEKEREESEKERQRGWVGEKKRVDIVVSFIWYIFSELSAHLAKTPIYMTPLFLFSPVFYSWIRAYFMISPNNTDIMWLFRHTHGLYLDTNLTIRLDEADQSFSVQSVSRELTWGRMLDGLINCSNSYYPFRLFLSLVYFCLLVFSRVARVTHENDLDKLSPKSLWQAWALDWTDSLLLLLLLSSQWQTSTNKQRKGCLAFSTV